MKPQPIQIGQWISIVFVGLLAACAAPLPTQEPASASSLKRTIVIADISDEPFATFDEFQPMADYLAKHLGDHGIDRGEVQVAPDLETMAGLMASGSVDIYFDSPYPAMIIADKSGATPILRRWKGGIADYSSVIFARADSGITSVSDLTGKLIAFEEDFSTSGYFLPLTFLLESKLTVTRQFDLGARVPTAEVGYVFSGDDDDTIDWVINSKVSAGATNHKAFMEIDEATRSGLIVLAQTETVARQVVLIRSGLDPALVEAIQAVLTEMDETPDGQTVLQSFEETAQFDEFPAENTLARMRELFNLVASP